MKRDSTSAGIVASGLEEAWENVAISFERFCLTAAIATLSEMMEQDAVDLCGARHGRNVDRRGYRWGRTVSKLGFHGGKVAIERPRVRAHSGGEEVLPSWQAAQAEDWLGRWAMNLMLINVSTRRFGRAVRLPEGDIAATAGSGVSKSAVSRRCAVGGTDPKHCCLFIVDGSKALIEAIRRTFGRHTPIQRCQVHKARNIVERLPKHLHASVRTALRQAWELDDAEKAQRLLRNLARRLEQVAPGVSASRAR